MKLPNFYLYEPLNELRKKMGASLAPDVSPIEGRRVITAVVTRQDLGRPGPLGLFTYQNERVVLYIRDIAEGPHSWEPQFHLMTCTTIKDMFAKGKIERYVVSNETNGQFKLNVVNKSQKAEEKTLSLKVCQNCLDGLHYKGFSSTLRRVEKKKHVEEFRLEEFFAKYPVSLHKINPTFDAVTAPLNAYTDDFPEISLKIKNERNWTCDLCRTYFLTKENREALHAHHVDGNKSNNARDNIRLLCLRCHAEQPDHAHMKNLPQYKQYVGRT